MKVESVAAPQTALNIVTPLEIDQDTDGKEQMHSDRKVRFTEPAKSVELPKKGAPPPAGGPPPKPKEEMIPYLSLYRYCSFDEKVVLWIGLIGSFLSGFFAPGFAFVIGKIVLAFDPLLTYEESSAILMESTWIFFVLAALQFFAGWIGFYCMKVSSEKLTIQLRAKYLNALMKQEIKYFESQNIEELPGKLSGYFKEINDVAGDKFGTILGAIGGISGGLTFAMAINPFFSAIVACYIPPAVYILNKVTKKTISLFIKKMMTDAKIGGFIEETLSAMKLIISFGREDERLKEFEDLSLDTYKQNKKTAAATGGIGAIFLAIAIGQSFFSWFICGFFFEYQLKNPYTGEVTTLEEIFACYQSLLFGLMQLLAVTNLIASYYRLRIVGKIVTDLIEREPKIQSPKDAIKDIVINKGITFDDVKFRYPTAIEGQPSTFDGASFEIKTGTSTAIVGPSGSGKSTIVQLINRFYDPAQGAIFYGSDDLKKLDLVALRNLIGYVGQEPVLIVGTIEENLKYGKADATDAEMKEALDLANANFVFTLPDKMQSYVGSSTVLNLSGG